MAGSAKKNVAFVKFIGDEEVGEHIVRRNPKRHGNHNKQLSDSLELSESFKKSLMKEKTTIKDTCKVILKPICLSEDKETEGKDLFNFKMNKSGGQTPKTANLMTPTCSSDEQFQDRCRRSRRSARKQLDDDKITRSDKKLTSKRGREIISVDTKVNNNLKTPLQNRSSKLNDKSFNQDTNCEILPNTTNLNDKTKIGKGIGSESIETPKHGYDLRRIKKTLAKIVDESSDELYSSSSDSESSCSKEEEEKVSDTPLLHSKDRVESATDDYFIAQAIKTPGTSNRTLSRLDVPQLDLSSLQEVVRKMPCRHEKQKKMLLKQQKKNFEKWMFQLSEGFNILLYGLGSKRQLILDFQETMLTNKTCVIINGFFPNTTMKTILTTIIEEALELDYKIQNPQDQLDVIKKTLSTNKSGDDLYVLFQNIDGILLRSMKAQNLLSHLADIPKLHVIASVDHVSAPLMWSQAMLSRFNWIWYDSTTFAFYIEEISYENSLLIQQSDTLVLSSLSHVFNSLTPNAKGIFLLLARYQLDQKDSINYIGMSFQECYQKCREAFLVSSDLTLRAQLTEFRDHKLIRSKKGADGMENLLIPLDASTLAQFLEEQESK